MEKPAALRDVVEKAKEMGMKPSSKIFVYADRALALLSDKTWAIWGFQKARCRQCLEPEVANGAVDVGGEVEGDQDACAWHREV